MTIHKTNPPPGYHQHLHASGGGYGHAHPHYCTKRDHHEPSDCHQHQSEVKDASAALASVKGAE